MKMKLKKGDTVVVIAGKDRGKTGKIVLALPRESKIVIEGVNVVKRHRRRTANARAGQIVEKAMPLHVSNVQLADPASGKPTRIRITRDKDVRSRVAVKSGQSLS